MAAFEFVSKTTLTHVGSTPFTGEERDARTVVLSFEPPENAGFDPRKHRKPANPMKPWMAYLNLIRLGFGPGFLGIPLAISQAGIVMGPILCITIGIILMHTQIMLLNCLNEVCRQLKISKISYRYGFRICLLHGPPIFYFLGNNGPAIVAVLMFMSQISICTVCYIFTADSLRDILDWDSNVSTMIMLLVPYLFLEHYLRTLMQISTMAMTANIMNFAGLGIIFFHIFNDPHGEILAVNVQILPIMVCFGIVMFNMSSVGMILAIDKGLENPEIMTKRFGVIQVGVMVPSLFAALYGCLGYWSFGAMEENILRSLPYDDMSTLACMIFYLFAVMLTYPMQCYPGTMVLLDVIEKHDFLVQPTQKTMNRIEMVSKPVFVLLTFFICYAVPFQGPFVAFCGCLCTNLLAIVFPAMMEICLLYPDRYGRGDWILIKDVLIIVMGIICWLIGAVMCGYLIYIRLKSLEHPNPFVA